MDKNKILNNFDNLSIIKDNAKIMLNFKPVANKEFPFIIHHPFISQNPAPFSADDGTLKFIDIFENKKEFKEFIKQREDFIDKAKSFEEMLMLVNIPYQLLFFKVNKSYLSKDEYNNCLRDIWCITEFPNADKNVSVDESLNMFKNADKKLIMSKTELLKLKSLPEEVTIYRGTHKKNNSKALSWTDDYQSALWFAKRFDNNGYVLQATIKKDDIVAFFNNRNENELIVDFNKIYDLKYEKIMDIKI